MSAKAAAEKAVKTVRGIDWGLLERLVKSDDGRKELLTLRRTIDETRTQLDLFRKRVSSVRLQMRLKPTAADKEAVEILDVFPG